MGRHQAPDAPGRDPALAPAAVPDPRPSAGPGLPADVPTERIGAAGTDPEATTVLRRDELPAFLQAAGPPAGRPPAGGPPVGATRTDLVNGAPPAGATRADLVNGAPPVGATRTDLVNGAPPAAATRADLSTGGSPPWRPDLVGGPAVGATRADLVGGGGAEAHGSDQPAPYQGDYNTGTFSRVLLTGLGGSAEPAGFEPAPAPAGPGAKDRVVATTRRLAARVAALRGDERTALLAVGAVVGIVLLMLAVLVVVVRLAGGSDASPAAASPPGPVASATPAATADPTATPEPTGSPLPPSGGSFTSRRSNLCLGVPPGRTDPGAQLVQRTCGTDFGTGFLLVGKDQPGTYELVSSGTSLCADVLGASMDDGAPVAQWDCNGGANQTFQLRPLTDTTGADTGYVQIVAAHSGKCLDVTNASADENAPIQQATCRDPVAEIDPAAGNQSWRFTAS